jgi:hypothetical protein
MRLLDRKEAAGLDKGLNSQAQMSWMLEFHKNISKIEAIKNLIFQLF